MTVIKKRSLAYLPLILGLSVLCGNTFGYEISDKFSIGGIIAGGGAMVKWVSPNLVFTVSTLCYQLYSCTRIRLDPLPFLSFLFSSGSPLPAFELLFCELCPWGPHLFPPSPIPLFPLFRLCQKKEERFLTRAPPC